MAFNHGSVIAQNNSGYNASPLTTNFTEQAVGTLLILNFAADKAIGTVSGPVAAGWSVVDSIQNNGGGNANAYMWYKISDGTETSVTITYTNSTNIASVHIHAYTSDNTPILQTQGNAGSGASNAYTVAVSTDDNVANAGSLCVGLWSHDSGADPDTSSLDQSGVERSFHHTTGGAPDIVCADILSRAAGALTWTGGTNSQNDQIAGVIGVFYEAGGSSSAEISGTATANIIESNIVDGGYTVDWTLTGDTFIAGGTGPIGTTAQSLALIQTLISAQSEAGGWNTEVRANMVATDLTRVSDTVARLTLSAESAYAITAQETITVGDIANAILTTSTSDVTPTSNIFTITPNDAVPDAFSFVDQTDVTLSTIITSAGITVSGINIATAVTCTGGTCSINGGPYSTSPGNCVNGDTITARHTSSASNSTIVDTVVTIGGVNDTFTSTTIAAPSVSTITTPAIIGGENLTGLEWAVFSSQDLSTATLLGQGSGETTNASGVLVLDITGSGANNGDAVWYVIKNTSGTMAAQGPATVVVT